MNEEFAVNRFLDVPTAGDIDASIRRILRDLDNPEPPLRLEMVRELLDLDRQFYSSGDDSALRETVHRLRIGSKQVIRRPSLLLDVVRKRQLKALWVPDRRRILIDQDLPAAKHRWGEAHEIGHSLIPWHEDLMHGDQRKTLSPSCEAQLEAEANYAAGRLLFLQDAFVDRVRSSPLTLATVRDLAGEFKNTITSTLWRSVEALEEPGFALVSQHPHVDLVDPSAPLVRYFVRSRSFAHSIAPVSPKNIYLGLASFCWGRRGPIGEGEIILTDRNGQEVVFHVEVFYNGHEALALGVVAVLRD